MSGAPWLPWGACARPAALEWVKRCRRPRCAAAAGGQPGPSAEAPRRRWCSASSEGGTKWVKPAGCDTGIQTYNSLSRRKEPLVLGNADVVTWYSCGPTVYDHAHLGHACSYVKFDIIRRIITKIFGKEVVMVMGITDIDDKIIKRADEMNISPMALARFYEEDFKRDMEALKVLPPTIYMRVTENIPQIIAFIQQLVTSGHGYTTSKGNVYFDICSWGDRYGKLRDIYLDAEEELAIDSDKHHMKDFALWKAARPQEVCWDSPWGKGRPGWHIECSTISRLQYVQRPWSTKNTQTRIVVGSTINVTGCDELNGGGQKSIVTPVPVQTSTQSLVFGRHLDIHTGGIDLAFPHHENEIAQCEAYHQCQQWGNYFLHSGHLHVKGSVKMSKSLKNYITIKDFLKKFSPDQFRMFCLRSGYRSATEYSDESLNDAKNVLQTIASFMSGATAYMKGQLTCDAIREDVLWE
ncbi:UNVERIFIED_CONTAM: putative cysteine--tRNA ligase, mitochondrial, partial [Gekko kuhli]